MNEKIINVIGAAIGIGAGNSGCHEGPLTIYDDPELFIHTGLKLNWVDMIEPEQKINKLAAMPYVKSVCTRIAKHTSQAVKKKQLFATIGGDHSCAAGTWSGVAHALRDQGDLGLIWIDAHMDSHTHETSDSGNIHGMPVAALLGHGEPSLTNILDDAPKLKPENICLIGIRCFEAAEQALLEKLGVRVYYTEEVQERGIDVVLKEALEQVTKNTVGLGISIDLDGIDPTHAPAVGTPVAEGICGEALIPALDMVKHHPNFLGFEIAEFNPELDQDHKTKLLIRNLMLTLAT